MMFTTVNRFNSDSRLNIILQLAEQILFDLVEPPNYIFMRLSVLVWSEFEWLDCTLIGQYPSLFEGLLYYWIPLLSKFTTKCTNRSKDNVIILQFCKIKGLILCLTDPCNTPAGNKKHRVTLMKILDRDKYETSTLQISGWWGNFGVSLLCQFICQKSENNYEIMIVNNDVLL